MSLLRRALIYTFIALLFFILGFALVNYIVMPYKVKSGDTTKIPNLVGMEYEKARLICQEKGLVLNKQGEKFEQDTPPGFIISQDPLPELVMKRGRRVDVIVSLGQELTSIPDVTGLEADRAGRILETAGLKVLGERRQPSEVFKEGKVMGIDPPPGSRVKSGTEITLIISTGPISFIMPLLEERTLEEAKYIIEDMGLSLSGIEYVRTDLAIGTVIGQKPPAGSRVVKGQKVELIISSGE
ncbi:MAG: PASTA domain-containing protein [Candidatus Glassbacteria bacterium]